MKNNLPGLLFLIMCAFFSLNPFDNPFLYASKTCKQLKHEKKKNLARLNKVKKDLSQLQNVRSEHQNTLNNMLAEVKKVNDMCIELESRIDQLEKMIFESRHDVQLFYNQLDYELPHLSVDSS